MSGRGGQTRGGGTVTISSESKSFYEIDLPSIKPREVRDETISYNVSTPYGEREVTLDFYRGSGIQNVSVFAGGEIGSPFRDAWRYERKYSGTRREDWVKVKGTTYISLFGRKQKIEVHWVQNTSTGQRTDFKVKRLLRRDQDTTAL